MGYGISFPVISSASPQDGLSRFSDDLTSVEESLSARSIFSLLFKKEEDIEKTQKKNTTNIISQLRKATTFDAIKAALKAVDGAPAGTFTKGMLNLAQKYLQSDDLSQSESSQEMREFSPWKKQEI